MAVMTAEKLRELGLEVPPEYDVHAQLDLSSVVHSVVEQVDDSATTNTRPHPGRGEMASFVPNDGNRHQI